MITDLGLIAFRDFMRPWLLLESQRRHAMAYRRTHPESRPNNYVYQTQSICKGICEIIQARPRYGPGIKRCNVCQLFIMVKDEAMNCPCCHFRLRVGPRGSKYKKEKPRIDTSDIDTTVYDMGSQ